MVKPVKLLSARELVASELRKAILTGKFSEGEEITQEKVAEMLGVSRMPVREAISILANDGLLKTFPNKSAIVAEIPDNYIKEHFQVRILLEGEATALACNNFENLEEIIDIHEQHNKAIEDGDIEQVHLLNQSFHIMIWDAAKNKKLKALLLQLWNGLSIVDKNKSLIHKHREHDIIIQAFKEKNPEKARQAMKKHLESSMKGILNIAKSK
jgi:DNA-binding GntR family transcriptional regulator